MRTALRVSIGPLVLGFGAWCAAGTLALADPVSTSVRLLVFASPLWLVAGVVVGVLLPACRRVPSCVTPALLAVLPWLPVPLPPALLIWTGRLAWMPVGLALLAALAIEMIGASDRRRPVAPASDRTPARDAIAAGALTLVVLIATAWSIAPRLPGGDEPHYLVITQSLLKDGDLRIENNHRARDYAAYYAGTLEPDFIQRGRGGVIYSIHAPGLPVLVAPLFAAFGYRGAQATVMLFTAIAGAFVWLLGWTASRTRGGAWFAWAATAASVTFLLQGVMIFPDGPAAAVTAAAAWVVLRLERRERVTTGALVALSAGLAALPFLHTRLVAIAAGVACVILWRLATDADRAWPERRTRILAFLAVPALGAAGWLSYFKVLYGTVNPSIPYGPSPEAHLSYVPGGVLGVLVDQQFGLLTFAPVFGLACVGWASRREAGAASGRSLLVVLGLYLAAVGTYWMWWAGVPATPARFADAAVPLFAPALAIVWRRAGPAGRTVALALLAITAATSAALIGIDHGALAWNVRDAHAAWLTNLEAAADVVRAWPSFFWNLTPGVASSEWPFVLHVLIWAGTIAVVSVAATLVAPRVRRGEIVAVWAMLLGLMGGAWLSWTFVTASRGLEDSRAQVRVLNAAASGARVYRLGAGGYSRATDPSALVLVVRRLDLPGDEAVTWDELDDVPPGEYDLTVIARRTSAGVLTVRVGDGPHALRAIAMAHGAEQRVSLTLPAGASALVFEPDPVLAAVGRRVELRARALDPDVQPRATRSLSANGVDLFFPGDPNAFVEDDGFWVRGANETDVVVASTAQARAAVATLTNGGVSNPVSVTLNGGEERMTLAPGESRQVPIALDARGTARVRIASPSGFRPSDSGQSQDSRFLGVRVVVRDAGPEGPALR